MPAPADPRVAAELEAMSYEKVVSKVTDMLLRIAAKMTSSAEDR